MACHVRLPITPWGLMSPRKKDVPMLVLPVHMFEFSRSHAGTSSCSVYNLQA